jgi:hypothetical protein
MLENGPFSPFASQPQLTPGGESQLPATYGNDGIWFGSSDPNPMAVGYVQQAVYVMYQDVSLQALPSPSQQLPVTQVPNPLGAAANSSIAGVLVYTNPGPGGTLNGN